MNTPQQSVGVVYLRRSTGPQERSLIGQLKWAIERSNSEPFKFDANQNLLSDMQKNGLSHKGDLFIDDSISGAERHRPGLDALLKRLLTTPRVGAVYVWNTDRLGRFRKALDGVTLTQGILDSGASIICEDKVTHPPEGRDGRLLSLLTCVIDSHLSGEYLYRLAANVLRGQIDRAKRGYWNGGQPAYGFARYLVEVSTGKPVQQLDPKEWASKPNHAIAIAPGEDEESEKKLEIVRLIHDLYRTTTGLSAVVKELNIRKIPPPHAGRTRKGRRVSDQWNVGTVRNILENPIYISKVAWARTSQGTHYRYTKNGGSGKRELQQAEPIEVNRDRESWEIADPRISYEPVVPIDLWEANYRQLKERGIKNGQRGLSKTKKDAPFPIGKMICGACGKEMIATTKQLLPAFVCGTYQRTTPKECGHNWVYRDQVLWFIIETIRRTCNSSQAKVRTRLKNAIDKQLRQATNMDSSPKEVERLMKERAEAEQLLDTAVEQKIEHKEPAVQKSYDKKIKQYGRQITQIDGKLRQIEKARKIQTSDLEEEIEAALAVLDDWHMLTEGAPPKKLKRLLGVLKPEVTVYFDVVPGARRKNQPREAVIQFQPDLVVGDVKGHMKMEHVPELTVAGTGVSAGGKTKLTKGNRGGQI